MPTSSAVNVSSMVMIRLASSKSEARRLAIRIPAWVRWSRIGRLAQRLKVAAIVGKNRVPVGCGKLQLGHIGAAKMLRLPRGQHLEAVRTQQLRNEHRYIFVEVEPDEEDGLGH